MVRERQAEEAPDDNTYLICPLRDDVVEAIRAEEYKSREKKVLAQERKAARLRKREIEKRDPKEPRRLREAGVLLLDSGISCVDDFKELNEFAEAYNDPLLSTQYVRREWYWQLSREQMQRAVARYYGWEKWSEDPWGSFPKFCEWMTSARDNEMAVWAVNETSLGRDYLYHSILEGLGQLDYSEMTEKDLLTQIGYGAACFLYVKSYTGWDDFVSHYPKGPLPVRLINEWVSKVYPFDFKLPHSADGLIVATKADRSLDIPERVPDPEEIIDFFSVFIDARNYGPLTRYRFLISSIYLWHFALDGARERAKGHPELEIIIGYMVASYTHLTDLCQKLAPKDYSSPDRNGTLKKMGEILKIKGIAWNYKKGLLGKGFSWEDKKREAVMTAQEGLYKGMETWVSKNVQEIIAEGLTDHLKHSLKTAVVNRLLDKIDEVKKVEIEVGDKLGKKETVKVQREIPASVLLPQDTEYTSNDLLELIAARQGLVENRFEDELDNRDLLDRILQNATLTKRQRLVINLTREGRSDVEMTLALEKAFGKRVTETNVRKLKHEAIQKLRLYAQQE